MDSKSLELRREHWRNIISECNNRKSGVTKKDWCRSNGISLKSLYYWQRQFRSEAVSSIETVVDVHGEQASPFLDITDSITASEQKSTVSDNRTSCTLAPELMIQACGCQIYVFSQVREKTLETVMRVLRNA